MDWMDCANIDAVETFLEKQVEHWAYDYEDRRPEIPDPPTIWIVNWAQGEEDRDPTDEECEEYRRCYTKVLRHAIQRCKELAVGDYDPNDVTDIVVSELEKMK